MSLLQILFDPLHDPANTLPHLAALLKEFFETWRGVAFKPLEEREVLVQPGISGAGFHGR
jgi:hypothetical protein